MNLAISQFDKVFDQKTNIIVDYWDKMVSKRCPVCGKDTLEWCIIADNQGSEPCIYQ